MLQADSVVASLAGVGTTLTMASNVPMDPSNPWSLVSYIPAVIGPVLVLVANRYLALRAARKRIIADSKDQKADQLEKDNDPTNDVEVPKLRLEAKIERAEADALEQRK